MIYFWKYLQATVVSFVHTGQHKRFKSVIFWKTCSWKKNFRIILTNLKITIVLECICFRERWCLYLLKRSYNFNYFHFYITILWQTLLNLHQLFLASLIVVCWIVFIFGILKAINLTTTILKYQTADIYSYHLSHSLIGK